MNTSPEPNLDASELQTFKDPERPPAFHNTEARPRKADPEMQLDRERSPASSRSMRNLAASEEDKTMGRKVRKHSM